MFLVVGDSNLDPNTYHFLLLKILLFSSHVMFYECQVCRFHMLREVAWRHSVVDTISQSAAQSASLKWRDVTLDAYIEPRSDS